MKKQILLLVPIILIAIVAIILMPSNVFAVSPDEEGGVGSVSEGTEAVISPYPEGMSEEFKAILNEEGKLVVTDTVLESKEYSINMFLNKLTFNINEYGFIVNAFDETTSVASIARNVWSDDTLSEVYDITVVFDECFSDVFSQLLNDKGELVIKDTNFNSNQVIVTNYLGQFTTENSSFNVCFPTENEDEVCTIQYYENYENGMLRLIEQHVVKIVYAEEFSEIFQQITKDGNLIITDSDQGDKREFIQAYCDRLQTDDYHFYVNANDDQTAFCIELYDHANDFRIAETHIVNVKFEEKFSDEFKKILNEDGKIVITESSLYYKSELFMRHLSNFETDYISFGTSDIDENDNICTVIMYNLKDDSFEAVEQHVVEVIYDEKFSDEFKTIFNGEEGNIVIKASRDYAKSDLIWEYTNALSNEKLYFMSMNTNEECTKAEIEMDVYDENSGLIRSEKHVVNVSYDKTMSDDFKKQLNKDGKFVFDSVKPSTEEELYCAFEVMYMSQNEDMRFEYISEDLTSAELTLSDSKGYPETHKVDIAYNYNQEANEVAKEIIKNFPKDKEYFMVNDMEIVNYWLHAGEEEETGAGKLDNYSGELKSYFDYKNFNLMIDHRLGADDEFFTVRGGIGLLQHNGISYNVNPYICVLANHILYVPDDTKSTKEALLAAVQKRVDEYAGKDKVKISAGEGTIDEFYVNYIDKIVKEYQDKIAAEKAKAEPDQDLIQYYEWEIEWYQEGYTDYFKESYEDPEGEHYFLRNAEGGFWFVATINGEDYEFIVIKDSKKMITPTYKTADVTTNIEISSTDTSIPLDTMIEATKITSGSEYERVMKILNVEDNETFDLKLYSNSLNDYVKKLENGTFEVKLPLPNKFKDKENLKVYYVDDKEKVHEYDVEVKDGFAIFTTDHFSIYTLSEKANLAADEVDKGEKDETPNTGSLDVFNYVLMITGISALGIIVLRKRV